MDYFPSFYIKSRCYCDRALAVAYGHIGITAAVAGHFTYFVIFAEYGFFPNLLFGCREVWENPAINDMPDSYGQEWVSRCPLYSSMSYDLENDHSLKKGQ